MTVALPRNMPAPAGRPISAFLRRHTEIDQAASGKMWADRIIL